tara:strand:- start:3247 stop:3867 length:621 start_codon:yes stop_codon:yes gene_type:complete
MNMSVIELVTPIVTASVGIVGTLVAIKYRHKLSQKRLKEEHICPISECITEDTLIMSKLKDVLNDISADRICIFSFHNGGHYYSGKSMQKMSMSYEQTDNGISSIQLDKQNIPVSACLTTVKPTIENGAFNFYDTQAYPEGLCKYYLLKDGVKSTFHWPIFDLYDNAIGIVRIDYVKRKTGLSDEDAEKLLTLSKQLPGYLISPQK